MPNLFVDSPNMLNKYSESQLEVLLLEFIFKYEDRNSVFNKVRRIFRQERLWKENNQQFPHGRWLRTTLKKIHSDIKTKSFKDHAIEHFGKKSFKPEGMWLSLDLKNFDEDFTIGNLSNSGKVDAVVGKTSEDSRKMLDKRYQLSKAEKAKIDEKIYDTDNVIVNIEPNTVNVSNATLQTGKIDIKKENIFDDNNIGYKIVSLNMEPLEASDSKIVEMSITDWTKVVDFSANEKDAHETLKDNLWKKENIKIPNDIYNPYVNYKLDPIITLKIHKAKSIKPIKGAKYEVEIKTLLIYDPIEELKVSKKDSIVKYNESRDIYLSTVKAKLDRLFNLTDRLPENTEEE